jgi:hypothetical protein
VKCKQIVANPKHTMEVTSTPSALNVIAVKANQRCKPRRLAIVVAMKKYANGREYDYKLIVNHSYKMLV